MFYKSIIYLFCLSLGLAFFVSPLQAKDRLEGKILLQVESVGEAWYVIPGVNERVYLGRPAQAFSVMREYGLGIKNEDLDLFLESGFPQKLAGKIVLAVEQNGEAYYINPDDLQGHYLGKPDDAFMVMRNLGLGISNEDLVYIPSRDSFSPVELEKETSEELFSKEETEEVLSYTQNLEISDEVKLLPYQRDLITFISQAENAYQIVKYFNQHFNILDENSLVAENYETVYQKQEGTAIDLLHLMNFVLNSKNYQSGILRFDDNFIIVFRDEGLPKYIAISNQEILVFEHGWSFGQVVANEEKRLNIKVDRYLYFKGDSLDYSQPIAPYNWINL